MATRFQIKRNTVSGVVPTTGDIANGELAVNLADRKLFTSNGSAVFELGSNLTNLSVTGNVTVKGIIANGSLGTSGHVLHSNGTSTYWAADDQGVTSVATGNGLTGGTITSTGTVSVLANSGIVANTTGVYVRANNGVTVNATGVYVTQGTGTVVNATGVHVNSAYIGTLTANNANNLNGQPASFYTNATNITTGTLNTARLPATANISTAVNVGANVNLSTSQISVGNSTVNVVINSTAISVTSDPLVQQSDIGTDPNQIPLNQYLGTLAYQSDTIAVSNVFAIGNAGYFAANGNVGIGTNSPDKKLTVNGDLSATSLLIAGSGDSIIPTTGVEGWYFAGSFSVSAQETEPRDVYLSSDGTKMFVLGNFGDDVNEYNLSTPWAVNTASYVTTFSVASQETIPLGLTFKSDGTAMYVVGDVTETVYQYTLSTPWSIATASYASKSFSVSAQETGPQAIEFSSDGTKMFILGSTGDDVNEYSLSTAWDVTTATYVTNFSIAAYENIPQGLAFNSTGTKMYVVGTTYARIVEYNLATPWSIATATFSDFNVVSNLGTSLVLGISGIYYNEAQGKAYISDYQNDAIFQLTTNVPSTEMVGTKFIFKPDVFAQQDLVVDRNGRFNGELRTVGTIIGGGFTTSGTSTLSGTVTMGTTTGTISIGTSQTTGTLTAGGTTGTGAIQIGRSTATQTIAIANGATTSGNTKTVEIGTAGLVGSITNITLGSTTGTVTTTINGNVGIGNSSPDARLTVTGTANISGNVVIGGSLNAANITASVFTGNLGIGSLTADYNVLQTAGIRFGHTNQLDSNDGYIAAGRFASGLNIVGTQTVANTGRQIRLYGTLIDSSGVEYVRNTGTWAITANNATNISGNNVLTVMESLRANRALHGGGTITVNASGSVLWSQRFIVISNGRGSHFSTAGFFNIDCPTSGTITGVGGSANRTATAAGITINAWEALYYILPIGSSSASVAANFRVSTYTADVEIPSDWLLICVRNGDNGNVYFNNGIILKLDQSYIGGSHTSTTIGSNTFTVGTGTYFVANGNVGIGTSSPAWRLTAVGGSTQISPGTSAQEGIRFTRSTGVCTINGINNDNNAYNALSFATGASEALRIDASGNVGIGTSSPAFKVDSTGAINAPFFVNPSTITVSYTIPTNYNAVTTGPITVANAVTVTVSDGSRWVVI